jgi:SAM-dependent methyltransferase
MDPSPSFTNWEGAVLWLRNQPEQAALVQAAYYDDPLTDAAHRYWNSPEWTCIRQLLTAPRGGPVLDVGAGRGIASFALAKEGFQVTALEPDPSAVVGAQAIRSLAQITGLPITVTEEFSERLPFADATFDLVFARAVLHHTRDLDAACREFFRVLRPGGRLLAVREHVITAPEDLPAFLAVHPLHRYYGGENAFMLSEYQRAIGHAGFYLKQSLAPLRSAVNYAPQTRRSLQSEVARRLAGAGGSAVVLEGLLRLPGVWALLLPLMEQRDNRPGRLYSFVADKA